MERSQIQKMLPEVMQRVVHDDSVLESMLVIMSELHEPTESLLYQLEKKFNSDTAPVELLSMLAHWMDLLRLFRNEDNYSENINQWADRPLPIGAANLRALIENASHLSQYRGTHYGMLEIATGVKGFDIDDGTQASVPDETYQAFHINVIIPAEAESYKDLIERIVQQEKPVYTTANIIQKDTVQKDVVLRDIIQQDVQPTPLPSDMIDGSESNDE